MDPSPSPLRQQGRLSCHWPGVEFRGLGAGRHSVCCLLPKRHPVKWLQFSSAGGDGDDGDDDGDDDVDDDEW